MLDRSLKQHVHTAHDALAPHQGKGARLAEELMGNSSPMRATALGRHVLKSHTLDEQPHMGKYIAPGKKYPTPHAAFPTWDNNGKPSGAAMVELRHRADQPGPRLADDYRLVSNEQAAFIGLQRASNGETRIATSLDEGIALAAAHPKSGVLVSINGDMHPHNLQRMTGGKLLVTERDTVLAQDKQSDPLPLIPKDEPKAQTLDDKADAAREAAHEQAERDRQAQLLAKATRTTSPEIERHLKEAAQIPIELPHDQRHIDKVAGELKAHDALAQMQRQERELVKVKERSIGD
jgi:hypothetical protein